MHTHHHLDSRFAPVKCTHTHISKNIKDGIALPSKQKLIKITITLYVTKMVGEEGKGVLGGDALMVDIHMLSSSFGDTRGDMSCGPSFSTA